MIIDVIVIVVFALSVFLGFRRGFSKTVLKLCGFFAAFLIVSVAGASFEEAVLKNDVGKFVKSKIYNITYEQLYSAGESNKENVLESVNLPKFIISEIEEAYDENSTTAYDNVSEIVSEKLFSMASKVAFFILLMLVFGVAGIVIPKIFKLPVLKQADKILGLIFGIVNGIFRVYIIMFLIATIASTASVPRLKEAADKSNFYESMYENGSITNIFK